MLQFPKLRVLLAHAALLFVALAVFTAAGGATTGGQGATAAAPQNTSPPTITGEAREGQTLSVIPGTWSGTTPITYTYQWFRCGANLDNCVAIAGATTNNYTVQSADVGKRLLVQVTATNAEGSGNAQASTGVVAPLNGAAPQSTAKAAISGIAKEGETLTASNGTWSGTTPMTFTYQWQRCDTNGANCADIAGATSQSYTVVNADVGHTLRVRVTATNTAGSASATSDPTATVASLGTSPASTAPPTLSGTPKEGETLTASNGTWSGTTPMTFTYQWQRCDANGANCANIAGATSQAYTLTSADVGNTVRVSVKATNAAGNTSATSVPSAVVHAATPTPAPGPAGQIKLSNGKTSIPATRVDLPARLVVDAVQFSPNPVRPGNRSITIRVHVSDTRGFVVRGALVFVRSTPLVTTSGGEQETQQDGWATVRQVQRLPFVHKRGFNLQFFARARKAGDNPLAGVSVRRLVQARTAR
jgi:fibronectin type 3 domain-containing protein